MKFVYASLAAVASAGYSNVPFGGLMDSGTFSAICREKQIVITINHDDCSALSDTTFGLSNNPTALGFQTDADYQGGQVDNICMGSPDYSQSIMGWMGTGNGKCSTMFSLSDEVYNEYMHDFASFSVSSSALTDGTICGTLVGGKPKLHNDNEWTLYRAGNKKDYAINVANALGETSIDSFADRNCKDKHALSSYSHDFSNGWMHFSNDEKTKSIKFGDNCINIKNLSFSRAQKHVVLDQADDFGMKMVMSQGSIFEPTFYNVWMDCDKFSSYTNGKMAGGFHVHQIPLDPTDTSDTNCGNTGGHHNPFGVSYKDPNTGESTEHLCVNNYDYEVGDLSRKTGALNSASYQDKCGTGEATSFVDFNMPLFGQYKVNDLSVVFHNADGGARMICRNLRETRRP